MLFRSASFENGRYSLHLNATKDTAATIVLGLKDSKGNITRTPFQFDDGTAEGSAIFKKGEEISLSSLMYKRLNAYDPQYFEKLSYEHYGGEKWYNLSESEQNAILDKIISSGDTDLAAFGKGITISNTEAVTISG